MHINFSDDTILQDMEKYFEQDPTFDRHLRFQLSYTSGVSFCENFKSICKVFTKLVTVNKQINEDLVHTSTVKQSG